MHALDFFCSNIGRAMSKSMQIAILILALVPYPAGAQSILGTKHNLSVSGTGTVKANTESEVCVFCHTPHNSSPRPPLWNRSDPGSTYVLYGSSTTQAAIGQPTGSALLCLSCHDGTIALGNVLSRGAQISFGGSVTTLPAGTSNMTTDLSDDHPVSFLYSAGLAAADGQLVNPATLTSQVQLENGRVQCTSCHDPHQNVYTNFLVASINQSSLCLACHALTNWSASAHKTSNATWNTAGTNPWPHTPFTTVASNACENCHAPHTAGGHARLLNYQAEETNCIPCHNGNVAAKNIAAQLSKTYRHNVAGYNAAHDPTENALVQPRHVECVDCHNPHQSSNRSAAAPAANGTQDGVKGIDTNGNPVAQVQNEYELCYRCHADSPDKPGPATPRKIIQSNVRLEFDLGSPSYHPVEGTGKNTNVPSLISPWTVTSKVYCSDCHASDGTSAPAGPHGSSFPRILKAQYSTADNMAESATLYALCYLCHNRNTLYNSSAPGYVNVVQDVHRKHVIEVRTPCNTCHDPHGISGTQGNSTNNTHLINFNTTIVSPLTANGRLDFEDLGTYTGRCYLRCHGEDHTPKTY
jgi:predicted CXXCH cytochrome family protein